MINHWSPHTFWTVKNTLHTYNVYISHYHINYDLYAIDLCFKHVQLNLCFFFSFSVFHRCRCPFKWSFSCTFCCCWHSIDTQLLSLMIGLQSINNEVSIVNCIQYIYGYWKTNDVSQIAPNQLENGVRWTIKSIANEFQSTRYLVHLNSFSFHASTHINRKSFPDFA